MVKKRGEHQKSVDSLVKRLEQKHYVTDIQTNIVYCLGEVDVLVECGDNREAYWEVKCNHTKKGYKKSIKQLIRWSERCYNKAPHKDYYGIYYVGGRCPEIICKNGDLNESRNQ